MLSKKKGIRLFYIFIFLLAFLILSLNFYINSKTINQVIALRDTVEDKVIGTGIITCYQTPLVANADGEALFVYEEGKLILPNIKIATLLSGEIDNETREKLRALNYRISYSQSTKDYKQYIYNDISSLNKEINRAFTNIVSQTGENNYSNVYRLKSDILAYNDRVLVYKGIKKEESGYDVLKEVEKLEKSLQVQRKIYYSPIAGIFSTKVDKFDEVLNPDIAKSLTPSQFDELMNTKPSVQKEIKKGSIFAKIINNFEWYLVTKLSEEDLVNLKPDDDVEIRIINNSDIKVQAKIVSISEPEDDFSVVLIKSTKYLEDIYTSKNVEFELIKSTNSGLKIPVSCIIEKDGKTGVYVVKDGIYRFIEVEILYSDENFIIIKDLSSQVINERENVILYDLIVSNPENIKEGDMA